MVNETDGKGTISKVGYLFDNPASFRKLEIEPNAFLNSHGQAAVRVIVYVHDTEVKQSSFLKEKTKSYSINDTIKLVIKDVYPGEKYQDTCINDIFILPLRQEKQTEIQ